MDKSSMSLLFHSLLFLQIFFLTKSQDLPPEPLIDITESIFDDPIPISPQLAKALAPAPALYIFGDSTVDGGNNNDLRTIAKAYYAPYGDDFLVGATGRFTNGDTIIDFLAQSIGLVIPIPYISNEEERTGLSFCGFNYASGSSGILPETGRALGENFSMEKQIVFFKESVQKYPPPHLNVTYPLSRYLSESIFFVFTGGDDYANNYLQPSHYNSSQQYNAEQFANRLITEFGNQLKNLYSLGARKIVVSEIGPLGCYPIIVNSVKPTTRCVEDINNMVSIFNNKLAFKLKELRSKLKGINFVIGKTYNLAYDMVQNPSHYGLKETRKSCCVVGSNGTGLCTPKENPCKDKKLYVFWDQIHLSEAANKVIATKCLNGSDICMTIDKLELDVTPVHHDGRQEVNITLAPSGHHDGHQEEGDVTPGPLGYRDGRHPKFDVTSGPSGQRDGRQEVDATTGPSSGPLGQHDGRQEVDVTLGPSGHHDGHPKFGVTSGHRDRRSGFISRCSILILPILAMFSYF